MKNNVKKIILFLRNIIFSILFLGRMCFIRIFYSNKKMIFTECYFSFSCFKIKNNNWGDDINKYLFEYVTKRNVINYPFSKTILLNRINPFSLIGSILTFYDLQGKIVYGSGIMNPNVRLRNKPNKIISVRGPKTRQIFIENGIECPEHYGDPALLLPVFYTPKRNKSTKGGLILNMGTSNNELDSAVRVANELNLVIIDMRNYNNWTDVIEQICSCDYIISESLHGLIVAETYGVPNVWVEFKKHPDYWGFKYIDYYESIGKEGQIMHITSQTSMNEILEQVKKWRKGDIDYKLLLSYFPFEINCPINESLLM